MFGESARPRIGLPQRGSSALNTTKKAAPHGVIAAARKARLEGKGAQPGCLYNAQRPYEFQLKLSQGGNEQGAGKFFRPAGNGGARAGQLGDPTSYSVGLPFCALRLGIDSIFFYLAPYNRR